MNASIVLFTVSLLTAFNSFSAASCGVLLRGLSAAMLTENQVTELVDKSKAYQDKRNQEWSERNKCLCCHTTLPYMLGRGLDANSRANFDKFKETAALKVEDSEARPWYAADEVGRNSKPTEAVLNAITLVMHDISSQAALNPTTLKALDRIFETLESDGRLHWLDFGLHPFESKNGELWGNSMALLAIELAKKHSAYEPPAAKYALLKAYVISKKDQLATQEMAVLLWANAQGPAGRFLSAELSGFFKRRIFEMQNRNGSFNQKAALGYGKREENAYATAISLIGIIKAGFGNHPAAHKAAKWLADNQETGNFLQMGGGTVLWNATSMNRNNSLLNNRFASDYTTSYSALALSMYRTEILARTN